MLELILVCWLEAIPVFMGSYSVITVPATVTDTFRGLPIEPKPPTERQKCETFKSIDAMKDELSRPYSSRGKFLGAWDLSVPRRLEVTLKNVERVEPERVVVQERRWTEIEVEVK